MWQKVIIGLKGLNVILILCVDLVPVQRAIIKFHQNFTGSAVQIVSNVWFWDNDGMGQRYAVEMWKVISMLWNQTSKFV